MCVCVFVCVCVCVHICRLLDMTHFPRNSSVTLKELKDATIVKFDISKHYSLFLL